MAVPLVPIAIVVLLVISFCVMCYFSIQEAFNSHESSLLHASNKSDTYYQYGNNYIHSNQVAYTPLSGSKGAPVNTKSNESIRQYFFYFLAFSTGARGLGIFMELIFYIMLNYTQMNISISILLFFRLLPTLAYLTMYSLVAAFLCYLYYTCKGLQFFQIRNFWLVSNVFLYALLISLGLVYPAEMLSYWILSCSNLSIFVFITWNSYHVQALISATPSISYPVSKISSRLIMLVYACLGALCINCVYYFLLAIHSISIDYTFRNANQLSIDVLLYLISDGIPTSIILLAIGKKNYQYLTTTINNVEQQRGV